MNSDQLANDQWAAISKDVAVMLWGEPNHRLSKGDRWRWGNRGSKSLDADKGIWKDFEANRGGGVLELVEIGLQTDRREALDWLKREGFILEFSAKRNVGRSTRRSARPIRYATRPSRQSTAQKPKNESALKYARILWEQSELIGDNAEHPFRAWARERNLLHPYCAVPGGIRYHQGKGLIICGVFALDAWGTDGIPKGDPVAVEALAIDQHGKKRYVLGPGKDRDKCDYGQVSEGVFILGDPNSDRVNIVEGIADVLAVYSREPGTMLATLGTSATLQHKAGVINWLTTKETWLYPDNDEAGDKGAAVLINCIKRKNPDAKVVKVIARAFEDPGQWAEKQPLATVERYDFDEKSGIFFDSGLGWGEADRLAIQTLTERKSNERE